MLGNYQITYNTAELTIDRKALDITANNQSKNYGDTFNFTGSEFTTGAGQLVNGDSVTSVTLTSTGSAVSATVGGSPYAIVPSAALGSGLGNYIISYHDGNLTVNAIALDITANNQSKNYGDTFSFTGSEFTVGAGQLKNSDSVTSVSLTSTGAPGTATVGGYPIVPSAALGSGLGNYNIVYHDGTLTVNAIALDIAANNQSKNYGDTFNLTGNEFTVGVGQLKNSDSVTSVTLSSAGAAATATVAGSPYVIASSAAVGSGLSNYTINYHDGSLTVNAIALDIIANAQSKTYGATFTFTGSEFTVGTGQLKNSDSVTSVTLTSAGAAATATVSGSPYDITPSAAIGTGLGNYSITYHVGHFTVNAKALDITANDQSKTYGATFTFTGSEFTTGSGQLVNGDTVTTVMLASAGAAPTATVSGSPYDITPSAAVGTGLSNYAITYHLGHFALNAKALDITANDQSKTYGATFTFTGAEFTTGAGQLINGDTVTSVTLTSGGAAGTATVTIPGPTYDITPSAAVGTGVGNYAITYHVGHLSIYPKGLDITANNRTKTYGDTVTFAGTEFTTGAGQLVNGNTVTSVTLTSTGSAATAPVAGSPYAILASAAVGTGLGNYTISYHNASIGLTVNKANATVTVTAYNVTYNGQPHTATYTITGVNGETGATVGTVILNTTHTNAGTYASDSWSFTGAANYNDISATTITDRIDKANATVVVTAYNVAYDYQSHTATVTSITGVNGEIGATVGTVDVSGTTHTLPGDYAGDPWSLTATANYNNTNGTVHDVIGYHSCTGSNPGGVILQPINADGSSIFPRSGRTVPVKFTVCDANGNPISDPNAVFAGTGGQLTMLSAVRGQIPNPDESQYNDIPDVAFRYTGGMWMFNMATSNLQSGYSYMFRINLKYGSITFVIAIK